MITNKNESRDNMIGSYQMESVSDNTRYSIDSNDTNTLIDEHEQFKNEILDHLSSEFKEYEFIKEERRNYLFYPFI